MILSVWKLWWDVGGFCVVNQNAISNVVICFFNLSKVFLFAVITRVPIIKQKIYNVYKSFSFKPKKYGYLETIGVSDTLSNSSMLRTLCMRVQSV